MSSLFLSHSSKDNVAAMAFKQWLCSSGWSGEDVFLDLDDIGAGERWKEALRKANLRCEAVILLASPDSLSSPECIAEVRRAEDYGKEVVIVLLRDIAVNDRRLDAFKERQIVDLSTQPQEHLEVVDYRSAACAVRFNAIAALSHPGIPLSARPRSGFVQLATGGKEGADPFPGLVSFDEDDAGIFFGRDADIIRGLDKLRILRRTGGPGLVVIQAASGAGKSSYLRAGLWPRLKRDPDFAPVAVVRAAFGLLTGQRGLGERFAKFLSRPGLALNPGDIHAQLMSPDRLASQRSFVRLIEKALQVVLEQRRVQDAAAAQPMLVIALDQAEELLAVEGQAENERFLELLGAVLSGRDRLADVLFLFTVRSDKSAQLLMRLADATPDVPEVLPLLPLQPSAYRDIIAGPLRVLERHGRKVSFEPALIERLAADAAGADALPLLAFTLSHLFREFGAGGKITLSDYDNAGGVAGALGRALKAALSRPSHAPAISDARAEQKAHLEAAFIPWLTRDRSRD